MSTLRIFVADDHEMVRIAALLAAHSGWEICGEADAGWEAVEKVAHLQPDIIMMDIDMPDMNGVEATRRIRFCGEDSNRFPVQEFLLGGHCSHQ